MLYRTQSSLLKPYVTYQVMGCLVQVGNGIELEAVGFRFEPYRWRPCGVTWDSSRTVVVIKLRRTSALYNVFWLYNMLHRKNSVRYIQVKLEQQILVNALWRTGGRHQTPGPALPAPRWPGRGPILSRGPTRSLRAMRRARQVPSGLPSHTGATVHAVVVGGGS